VPGFSPAQGLFLAPSEEYPGGALTLGVGWGCLVTFRDILSATARRWYIPLVVIAAAAGLLALFAGDGGVYATRTVITFTLPQTTSLTPGNGAADRSLIAFAGAVAGEVNNGRPAARYSTDDAPFYGAGIREGVLVALPSAGNQWYSDYSRAEIELQIVGRSEAWVSQRQQELVAAILRTADERQDALAPLAQDRIEVEVVPLTLSIERVAASRTTQVSAAAGMLLAAAIVSCWLAVRVDRRRGRGADHDVVVSSRVGTVSERTAT